MACGDDNRFVILGRVSGLHGVGGLIKIHSYTRPRERIFSYHPWYLREGVDWVERQIRRERSGARTLIAAIDGLVNRDEVQVLVGADVAVRRNQLPELQEGEYYHADLIGLDVIDQAGNSLGQLLGIEETGANDVMVVQGERRLLIPLVMGEIVTDIDMGTGIVRIDWNPEYL